MTHEIVWTAGAESDLLDLYGRLGDPELALKVLREPLVKSLQLLADNPALGSRVKGARRVRRLLTGPGLRFGIFYVEEGARIMVHAFLDMRADPRQLEQRLRRLP